MLTVRSLRSGWASSTKTALQVRHETRKNAETIHSGNWLLCPCWGSKDPWHLPGSSDTLPSMQPGPSQVTEGRRIFRCQCKYQGRLKSEMWLWLPQVQSGSFWRAGVGSLLTHPMQNPEHCKRLPGTSSPSLWHWAGRSPLQGWDKRELSSHPWPA